jgi:hypothetical protein
MKFLFNSALLFLLSSILLLCTACQTILTCLFYSYFFKLRYFNFEVIQTSNLKLWLNEPVNTTWWWKPNHIIFVISWEVIICRPIVKFSVGDLHENICHVWRDFHKPLSFSFCRSLSEWIFRTTGTEKLSDSFQKAMLKETECPVSYVCGKKPWKYEVKQSLIYCLV